MDKAALKTCEVDQFDEVPRQVGAFFCAHALLAQAKFDIALDIEPGEERRFLKQQYALCAWAAYL
jgi:hypothetical protein